MNLISEHDYMLSQANMTEDDYIHWQKLIRSMTTAARMMGLKDSDMTRRVFRTSLTNLMDFEKEHSIQFYELGVSLANADTCS